MITDRLARWARPLSALAADVATGLGPLVSGIDALVSTVDSADGSVGEPNGYGELSRRGSPERLLLSQWLLAEELPDEFLRRAAEAELLHLAPIYRHPHRHGRVTVLVDVGLGQLGAARLAQLAALIVLHRRAEEHGSALTLSLTSDPVGELRTAEDLPELMRTWLHARQREETAPEELAARVEALAGHDEVWVLAGSTPITTRGRHFLLSCDEHEWGAQGVTSVQIGLRGHTVRLGLPPVELGVRILRGYGFRAQHSPSEVTTLLSHPAFSGRGRRLIARGSAEFPLISVTLPAGKVTRHSLSGEVLAAAHVGKRLVALVHTYGMLRVQVIGNPLPRLERLQLRLEELGLTRAEVEAMRDRPLGRLAVSDEVLQVELGARWWALPFTGKPIETEPEDVVLPGMIIQRGSLLLLGQSGVKARSTDRIEWELEGLEGGPVTICVDPEHVPFGVVTSPCPPSVLALSPAGVVHLTDQESSHALSRWPGVTGTPQLHAHLPWILVERRGGVLEIIDVYANELVCTVRGGS